MLNVLVEKYGVMNFPSLLVLKGDGTVERFTEDFKYERLHQFLKVSRVPRLPLSYINNI